MKPAKPRCRAQLLVDAPLQFYVVGRVVALCAVVAAVTAGAYVGVDRYVEGRGPTTVSLVPLLLAITVTVPLVAWRAMVLSQRVVAPFVRLLAWTRRATVEAPIDDLHLRLRAGDPSAELVAALQRAIVERVAQQHESPGCEARADDRNSPDACENPDVAATTASG